METLNPTTSTTVDDAAANIGFSILMRFSDSRREIDLEIRKLITVMCQVFRDHKAPPTPLAYLSATCSSLDLIAASKPRPSDDMLHAHITILSIVIPKVPPAFLINNLQLVCNSLALALRSSSPSASFDSAACTGVKYIAQLLISSANCVNNWSQVSKPFRSLFSFAYVVFSIEVREQAGLCVHDTLQSFRGTPLFGPASKTITDLLMKKYLPPRVESNTDGVNRINQLKAMYTLNLVMLCLGAMSTEDRTAVLVYFKDLLELHHTYVTRLITDALYRLCLHPSSPDVDLELLLDLICSICLSVSQHKMNFIMKTIAGLLNFGVPKVYSLNKEICKIKLPIMFDALIVLLEQSDLRNVQDAANALMRLVAYIDEGMIKQGVDRALMNANMENGSQSEPTLIEKLCATFPKLLSYRCTNIRHLVFEIVSTMFNKLGVHSAYLMRGTVKTLADMQILPDREFPFKEEVKLLLEMVSEKCGLDAILAIIPQEHMELLAEINQQLGSKSVDASSHVSKAITSGNNLSQSKYVDNYRRYYNMKRKLAGKESLSDLQWRAVLDRQARRDARQAISKGILGAARMAKKLKL
ncbi:hypothetical protein RchiOBHm_Chr2g0095131 [Rosa chinensis]|uniref:Uncharacterized protein n=1 Tax=Rosa chinensis TaxID=74649 RepID=A0A2P6RKQ1_ROSCH|nr:uncharacterized protein LOC112183440 [Rosa chinensis]PRQ47012.1 hypothetical protein RchiOBHm_Chr2g0095131 [Rosa chinensis]